MRFRLSRFFSPRRMPSPPVLTREVSLGPRRCNVAVVRRFVVPLAAPALVLALAAPALGVVYGSDDRVDVSQASDATLRALATSSAMPLVGRSAAEVQITMGSRPIMATASKSVEGLKPSVE